MHLVLRFLTDQNFRGDILSGLLARLPTLDIVRVQEQGLSQALDEDVLAWAAQEGRIVLTHDKQTMIGLAYDRVIASKPMPGVVHVGQYFPLTAAINDLLTLALAGSEQDVVDQVLHLPL